MGCGDVGGGSTTNTAGWYIGTDPVGEGGDIHAGQDEEHQAGHGGYYESVAWGGCLPPTVSMDQSQATGAMLGHEVERCAAFFVQASIG
jgi:hypothetical protein